MASEDIILTTLIEAGLRLKKGDLEEVQRKLNTLNVNTGDDFAGLRKQAEKIGELGAKLKKERELLERAATKGFDPKTLDKGQTHQLRQAFNDVKVYHDQLGGLTKKLVSLGNAGGEPLFQELSGLEAVFKRLGAVVRNVAPVIDRVSTSYKANAAAQAKAQRDADKLVRDRAAQAKTANTLERARRVKAIQTPEGRKVFLTAARGNAEAITTSAAAKQGRSFAASALTAGEKAVRLERDRSGPDSAATLRAERKLNLSARTYDDLNTRAGELAATEADNKRIAREQKQAAAKVSREQKQVAAKAATKAENLAKRQQNVERNTRTEALSNSAGQKAFFSASRGETASILTRADASAGVAFAKQELAARKEIHKQAQETFKPNSREVRQALRDLEDAAQATERLKDRVTELKDVEALRKKNAGKAEALTRTQASVASARTNNGRKDRIGRKALEQAGGIEAGVAGFKDLAAAKNAERFITTEVSQLTRLQNAYATAFGATSTQARTAAIQTARYSDYLGKLRTQIGTLNVAKQEQNNLDQLQEKLQTSEDRRRTKGISNVKGKQLFERANGDYSTLQTLADVKKAAKFAETELQQLELQQHATAKAAGRDSVEYDKATKEVNKYAHAVAELNDRKEQLTLGPKARVLRPSRTQLGSAVYPEGRTIYQNASKTSGGLKSLSEDDAASAKRYVQARLSEVRSKGKELSSLYEANGHEATAAGNAARKYAKDLEILNAATRPASQGLNLLQSTLRSFLKYAVGYAALYGLAAAIMAVVRSTIDLQTEFLEIQAVTGATDEQMGKLSNTVLDVAKNSKFSLLELTKAAKVLAQAGVSVDDMNTSLRATADFAAATGANLEVAADILSTTRAVFSELSDDVIANQLAKAINISKLTAEDLKTILSLGAQTAKSFSVTSEQFLAAVATLRNAGLKQSTAATGLRQSMLEIFSPDAKLTQALQARYRALGEDMGTSAVKARFFAFTRARNPLIAALTELKRLGFNDEGQMGLSRAFDIRSTNAIKAMIANLDELAQNESKITFGRAAAEGARTTVDGLSASFTRLLSTVNGFAYSRSEGVLGFFTEVVQSIDKAIQKADEWDLRQRSKGGKGLSEIFDAAVGGLPKQFQFARRLQNGISGKDYDPDKSSAASQTKVANAKAVQADKDMLRRDEVEKSAIGYDVNQAKPGTSAEQLKFAAEQLDELRVIQAQVFGPELAKDTDAVRELVKSYTDLAPTQRLARRDVLKATLPGLKELDGQQIEDTMFTMRQLSNSVDGTLKTMSEGLLDRVNKSNKVVNELKEKKRDPESMPEIEAATLQKLYLQDAEVQKIALSNTTANAEFSLNSLTRFSQAYAESLRAHGGAMPLGDIVKDQTDALILKTKAIAKTTVTATAIPEVRAQTNALIGQFKDTNQAAIDFLNGIAKQLSDAADAARNAGEKALLKDAAGVAKAAADDKQTSILKETADRVKYGEERVAKALKEPNFKKDVLSTPIGTPGRALVTSAIDAGTINPADFAANNANAQALTKFVTDYDEITSRNMTVQQEVDATTGKLIKLETAARRANEALGVARTDKQSSKARSALGASTAAEAALVQYQIDEAQAARTRGATPEDAAKNKSLIEQEARARARLSEIYERAAKERAQIDREETKYNLKREEDTLRNKKKRLGDTLDSATFLTPQSVIDETIKLYDENNAKLKDVFERRVAVEGELNGLSQAQIEEEKKKLRPFREQAASEELIRRQEEGKLADVVLPLDLAPTSGDTLTDARSRERGLEPGDRTQRRDYLSNRANILSDALTKNSEYSKRNSLVIDDLRKRAAMPENLGDAELTKSLEQALEYEKRLSASAADWRQELGNVELGLEHVTGTFASGFKQAFDPEMIQRKLEQSENSFEHFGAVINEHVVNAIEGIGDAFADAALEGESLSDSMNKVFAQLQKDYLRTVIKTLSNETLGSLTGTLFGDKKKGSAGLFPSILTALGVGAAPATSAPVAAPADATQPISFMDKVSSALFGKGQATETAAQTDACCLPKETGDALKKVAQSPDLASVVQAEGKGFFASLGSGFTSLLDNVTSGFGKVFGNLGGLLGLTSDKGSDQAIGLFSLATNLMGAFAGGGAGGSATYKGAYGFAGGGIIRGPGSGTSDSIPAYVLGAGGRKQPLALSDGESILTAKATAALGPDFVNAANSGRLLQARTNAMISDQASLSASTSGNAAPAGQPATTPSGPVNYQVHVSAAQLRMRMGDWLDQQILNERARR